MKFLLSLLAIAVLTVGALTACNSAAQSNRQQAQNKNSTHVGATNNADSTAAHDEHSDGIARISLEDAKKAFDNGTAIFVDTRAAASYEGNHIKGAFNIPAEEFTTRYKDVPSDKQIITYCS